MTDPKKDASVVSLNDLLHQFGSDRAQNRNNPRINIRFEINYTNAHGRIKTGVVKNLSRGGAFVECDQPEAVDRLLEFSLSLPDLDEDIDISAKVVHQCQDEERCGMGLCFKGINDHDQRLIGAFVLRKCMTEQLGNSVQPSS